MKDNGSVQCYVRLYCFDKSEAAQVSEVKEACILAWSTSLLLSSGIKKLEIGITSQKR